MKIVNRFLFLSVTFLITLSAYSKKEPTFQEIVSRDKAGDAQAQCKLGEIYYFGEMGQTRNEPEAIKWDRVSALQGNACGQLHLAEHYEYGFGVTQDQKEAVKWFALAANQGDVQAQYEFGHYYLWKDWKDLKKAIYWLTKGAKAGHGGARMDLAQFYEKGEGVPWNEFEAIKWYVKASEKGESDANYCLYHIYENGKGVRKDKKLADEYLEKFLMTGGDMGASVGEYLEFGENRNINIGQVVVWTGIVVNKITDEYFDGELSHAQTAPWSAPVHVMRCKNCIEWAEISVGNVVNVKGVYLGYGDSQRLQFLKQFGDHPSLQALKIKIKFDGKNWK